MKTVLMGIDLGTTGVKLSLIEEGGKGIASAYREYGMTTPLPGYSEQDPEDWWRGVCACCRELKERVPKEFSRIAGIGICGQMHTQVYLDKNDAVLRPSITWMDQRSKGIVERMKGDPDVSGLIFKETANSAATTYTAPNCMWVRENEPELWKRVSSVLVAKDFIKFRLSGVKATDYSEASGTLLFDVAGLRWSEEMERLFGVEREKLPQAGPSDTVIGRVHAAASKQTGIAEGVPVANGSADNSASALGAGMMKSGQVTLIIGTAGVVSVCSDRPLPDPRHRVVCWNYCLTGRWISLGVTQTAGESLNWFKESFDGNSQTQSSGDIFQRYDREVEGIPDGSGGLIFLPYLNGERTPYWDSNARGVFFGVNLTTRKAHFIKSVMEGVSFALRNNIETVESLGLTVNEVRAVGGGLKSPVWLSCLAKILKRPVRIVPVQDTGNWGNVLLCGKAIGLFPSIEDAMADSEGRLMNEVPSEVYERQYAIFLRLYEDLRTSFRLSAE